MFKDWVFRKQDTCIPANTWGVNQAKNLVLGFLKGPKVVFKTSCFLSQQTGEPIFHGLVTVHNYLSQNKEREKLIDWLIDCSCTSTRKLGRIGLLNLLALEEEQDRNKACRRCRQATLILGPVLCQTDKTLEGSTVFLSQAFILQTASVDSHRGCCYLAQFCLCFIQPCTRVCHETSGISSSSQMDSVSCSGTKSACPIDLLHDLRKCTGAQQNTSHFCIDLFLQQPANTFASPLFSLRTALKPYAPFYRNNSSFELL